MNGQRRRTTTGLHRRAVAMCGWMEIGIGVAVNICIDRDIGERRRHAGDIRPAIGTSNPVVVTIGAKEDGAGKSRHMFFILMTNAF